MKYFNTVNFVIACAALLVVLYTFSDTLWKPRQGLDLPSQPTIAELPSPLPELAPESRVPVATAQTFSPRRVGTTETTPTELTRMPQPTPGRTPQVVPRQSPRQPGTTQVRPSIPLGVPSAPSARSGPGRIATPRARRRPSVRRPGTIPAPTVADPEGVKRERGEGPAPPPVRASTLPR